VCSCWSLNRWSQWTPDFWMQHRAMSSQQHHLNRPQPTATYTRSCIHNSISGWCTLKISASAIQNRL
jgi:hypothetical protein